MVAGRPRNEHRGVGAARPLLLLGLVFAALGLVGCGAGVAPSAEDEVKAVVLRYDRLLAEGYRTMDMNRLQQVAEQLQGEDEYIHMSALGEGGVRLLPVMTDQEFTEVSVEATSAQVQTRESWDYVHEDRITRETILIQRGMVYELVWDLVLASDGRWLVSDVRALEATSTIPPEQLREPPAGLGLFQ